MSERSISESGSMISLNDQLLDKDRKTFSQSRCCCAIMRLLCCIFDSDEEMTQGQNLRRMRKKRLMNQHTDSSQRDRNFLTLMGSLDDGNNCLTRITQRNFFVDVLQRKPVSRFQSKNGSGAILFSMFDNGVKLQEQEYARLLPEKLLRYLAKRIISTEPQFMMDVRAGSSGPYLFLTDIPLIALVQEDNELLNNARHNSQLYFCHDNLEFIQGDLNCVTHLSPDILYIHPCLMRSDEPFSIYTHLVPDIKNLLYKCLQICENIVLILPKLVQPSEVASLVSYFLRKLSISAIKIEIQKILIDGVLQHFVVYIGSPAMIDNQDELQFIAKMLICDRQQEEIYQPTYVMLNRLCDTQSLRQILDRAVQAQINARNKSETILSIFINQCLQDHIFQRDDIDEIFQSQEQEVLYQSETPCYRPYTPATFDPKELESSNLNWEREGSQSKKAPPRQPSLRHNKSSKTVGGSFQQLPQKTSGSIDFFIQSINNNNQDSSDTIDGQQGDYKTTFNLQQNE